MNEEYIVVKWVDKSKGMCFISPLESREPLVVLAGLSILTSLDDKKFNIIGELEVKHGTSGKTNKI